MPITGFRCPVPTKTVREVCSPEECLASCLKGEGCHPPAYIANITKQVSMYNNSGTISGSGLKPECDLKPFLERTRDFLVDPGSLHWASYRGALVHTSMEEFAEHPAAKDWIVEQRFYAAILPAPRDEVAAFAAQHGVILGQETLLPGVVPIQMPADKEARIRAVEELNKARFIILSGQVDSYDAPNKILWDYKTTKWVSDWVLEKEGYFWQVRFYAFLLRLHGHDVQRAFLSFMDAAVEQSAEVSLGDLATFVRDTIKPVAQRLWMIRMGFLPAEPTPNFLCMPNKEGRVYCNVREHCAYWTALDGKPAQVVWIDRPPTDRLVEPSKCYSCGFYVTAAEKKAGVTRQCPSRCPNIKETKPDAA
jgi:hypothetical protein